MAASDPSRFHPHRESLATTLIRTGGIAIVVASIATVARVRGVPSAAADWQSWLALFVFVAWISFGGHWVEVAYLNGIRPKLASWSDKALVVIRVGVWLIGGAILFLGAVTSRSLMTTGTLPAEPAVVQSLLVGGPIFVGVELLVHGFLRAAGKASFWDGRG